MFHVFFHLSMTVLSLTYFAFFIVAQVGCIETEHETASTFFSQKSVYYS